MDPATFEIETGVRSTLQSIPNCQQSLEQLNIPLSIHLTPAKKIEGLNLIRDIPNKCICGGYLNPSSVVNFATKTWFCNFCLRSIKLSQYSSQILKPDSFLPEQEQSNKVIEYKLPDSKLNTSFSKNNLVFLVDTCLSLDNLNGLKTGLIEAIHQIDFSNSQVMLLSYSRNINIFRNNATKTFVHSNLIPGYETNDEFLLHMSLKKDFQKEAINNLSVINRFLFTNKDNLINAINSIECDSFLTPEDERSTRASGKTIDFALELIKYGMIDCPRILFFTGGPCTYSSGRIADPKISSFIRKHLDLEQNPEIKSQIESIKKYYSELASKAIHLKTTIDIWAFSLTEFGLFEMEHLASKTNGVIVIDEEFKQDHFLTAITKYFKTGSNGQSNFDTGASIELLISKEIKISGCIGNCQSQNTKPSTQSENPIGESNTNRWFIGGLDSESTFLFLFELGEKLKTKGYSKYSKAYFQFNVTYKHPIHGMVCRVISFDRTFIPFDNPIEMLSQVDQYSLISTYAKIAAYRVFEYDNTTLIRYLDKTLISLLRTYRCNETIPEEIGLIAQFFYYLRKSNFVKKFASSLDEMTFYKHTVLRETIDNTLIIVQPQIIEYSLNAEEPKPVLPDLSCMKKDVILLADTFFNIIIWNGSQIKSWIDDGYHLQSDYAHLADLLKMPEEDYATIVEERIVQPSKIYAHFGSPTERFLKSRLNPENVGSLVPDTESDNGNFITEDASLSVFMNRLLEFLNEPKKN